MRERMLITILLITSLSIILMLWMKIGTMLRVARRTISRTDEGNGNDNGDDDNGNGDANDFGYGRVRGLQQKPGLPSRSHHRYAWLQARRRSYR
jgi:hypothetical protein